MTTPTAAPPNDPWGTGTASPGTRPTQSQPTAPDTDELLRELVAEVCRLQGELRALRAFVKKPWSVDSRNEHIKEEFTAGRSARDIACGLGISQSTVKHILARFRAAGEPIPNRRGGDRRSAAFRARQNGEANRLPCHQVASKRSEG
jgi:DNA-binding CsgD family transcriptional regulator